MSLISSVTCASQQFTLQIVLFVICELHYVLSLCSVTQHLCLLAFILPLYMFMHNITFVLLSSLLINVWLGSYINNGKVSDNGCTFKRKGIYFVTCLLSYQTIKFTFSWWLFLRHTKALHYFCRYRSMLSLIHLDISCTPIPVYFEFTQWYHHVCYIANYSYEYLHLYILFSLSMANILMVALYCVHYSGNVWEH